MMRSVKTQGLVLKKTSLLNKDIVFTIFTELEGKVRIIAKGVKKITSRRAPHIQTGNLIEIEVMQKGEVLYLQGTFLISAFSEIKSHQLKTQFLYTYFFILDRALPEHQQEPELFYLSKSFLVAMAQPKEFSLKEFTHHLNLLVSKAGYSQGEKSLSELVRTVEEVINEKVPVSFL
jgi:DNA repair protein RecO (recombination protein O)